MNKTVPAGNIKKAICYLYLLAFCPPSKLREFQEETKAMRSKMAEGAGMKEAAFMKTAVPEACRYITAYHQASREPDKELVDGLAQAALKAGKDEKNLRIYKDRMNQVVKLPGRAKPENRLHRSKGCQYCLTPCRYGYFTLVSDPDLKEMQDLFNSEAARAKDDQTPLRPAYAFAMSHLMAVTGSDQGTIAFPHVVNLAFCLLLLGMAKSRLPIPEQELYIFQTANRMFVRRLMKQ